MESNNQSKNTNQIIDISQDNKNQIDNSNIQTQQENLQNQTQKQKIYNEFMNQSQNFQMQTQDVKNFQASENFLKIELSQNLIYEQDDNFINEYDYFQNSDYLEKDLFRKNLTLSPKNQECYDLNRILNQNGKEKFIQENTCPICLNLVKDTCQCQLGCQGLFGYKCIQHSSLDSCPYCRNKFCEPKEHYRNDKVAKLNSCSLKLKCANFQQGCKVELPYYFQKIDEHEKKCEFAKVECKNSIYGCKWENLRKKQAEHQKFCEFQQVQCKLCKNMNEPQIQFNLKQGTEHLMYCENLKLEKIAQQLKKNLEKNDKDSLNQIKVSFGFMDDVFKMLVFCQEKIKHLNQKLDQMVKFSVCYEKNKDKKRDKEFILQDFKKGIVNFNSLEQLREIQKKIDNQFIKGVRWNENNLDVNRSVEKSLYWVKKSIEQNCPEGKYLLGRIQHNQVERKQEDLDEILALVNSANQLGNPEAKNFLGFIYGKGEGISQNQEKALKFYKQAAEMGNFAALLNLGSYYEGGYGGLEQNFLEAFRLFYKSAKKGYINAMVKVVQLLRSENEVPCDEYLAFKWQQKIEFHSQNYTHVILWQQGQDQ
ncbi:TRAF-like protein [Pseudocohnilembus persalinus]|uniref:TRAF-like protein n=1 Tax=Pseudocohnilembus persalinus TaxID=266149 RepID=A0A0V0R4S9_PSEPJ|nr:TRAF-like protein [Pseudocohnilembus persalinus]|eukprot:KRX09491.1 TRAF-like protein [Pseudocohnilembus persalinus]